MKELIFFGALAFLLLPVIATIVKGKKSSWGNFWYIYLFFVVVMGSVLGYMIAFPGVIESFVDKILNLGNQVKNLFP
jgi:TM2 domain-containing membrane protein YozV